MLKTTGYALLLVGALFSSLASAGARSIVVSAEGLADPEAETYQRDRGLMIEDLRKDARRQVIEKAVGTLVETSTLVENYDLINERVLTQSAGFIKQVIKESDPWIGEDGFAHMLLKAEVALGDIRESLDSLSTTSRIALIKEQGNPRIAVAVNARNAERGPDAQSERSGIAENVLKEQIKAFGYRVWSDPTESGSGAPLTAVDFRISGDAKFEKLNLTLKASGLTVTKYKLTSWSVKCVDVSTGEEIYFNNQVPKAKSWASEDEALQEIGALVGGEFSRSFFQEHLIQPTRVYQLQIGGLPDYDSANLIRKELIGLRSVINVDLRNFDAAGLSLMEVEFSGSSSNFSDFINASVVKPLNEKLGKAVFKLTALEGNLVQLTFQSEMTGKNLADRINSTPPAALVEATPQRIQELIKSDSARERVAGIREVSLESDNESLMNRISNF